MLAGGTRSCGSGGSDPWVIRKTPGGKCGELAVDTDTAIEDTDWPRSATYAVAETTDAVTMPTYAVVRGCRGSHAAAGARGMKSDAS